MLPISYQDARRPHHLRRRNALLPHPVEHRTDLPSAQTPSVTATMRQALLFEQKVEEMKPSKRYAAKLLLLPSSRSPNDVFKNNWESLLEFRAEKIN